MNLFIYLSNYNYITLLHPCTRLNSVTVIEAPVQKEAPVTGLKSNTRYKSRIRILLPWGLI